MIVSISFSDLTTMRVGGPSADYVKADDTHAVLDAVREVDHRRTPLLIMSGGSNLVVGDQGFDGMTLQVASSTFEISDCTVRADAGLHWDHLVRATLDCGLAGLEPLSGIPGSVGGTPVQNVGAFGTLTSDVLSEVTVYDRQEGTQSVWPAERCGFGSHRQSVFKHTERYVVLDVTFQLRRSHQSVPVTFVELAKRLSIDLGGTADTRDVREAVLQLRRKKGSIYDPSDHDTWGVGSFFINPVLKTVPEAASGSPTYPDTLGTKLPAGWLIDHAGFPPGYGSGWGRGSVTLSSKHALVVTNRGDATTSEVMAFAAHIRDGVEARFGIRLGPECRLVNCSFDDVTPYAPSPTP